mgnify:CR=1 FL=1
MQRSSDEFQKSDKTKIPAFLQILGFVENPLKFFFEKKYIFFSLDPRWEEFYQKFSPISILTHFKIVNIKKKKYGWIKQNWVSKNPDSIQKLLEEITGLEANISVIKTQIQTFENTIRAKLNLLISRLIVLNQKMKEKQHLKKEKRLEQKRRGKNYKEPIQSITTKKINKTCIFFNESDLNISNVFF